MDFSLLSLAAVLNLGVTTQAKRTVERAWLSEVSNIPLQQSVADLGVAFKHWFASLKGKGRARFPRFKNRHGKQSARFRKGGFSLKGNKLFLAKLGGASSGWGRATGGLVTAEQRENQIAD